MWSQHRERSSIETFIKRYQKKKKEKGSVWNVSPLLWYVKTDKFYINIIQKNHTFITNINRTLNKTEISTYSLYSFYPDVKQNGQMVIFKGNPPFFSTNRMYWRQQNISEISCFYSENHLIRSWQKIVEDEYINTTKWINSILWNV